MFTHNSWFPLEVICKASGIWSISILGLELKRIERIIEKTVDESPKACVTVYFEEKKERKVKKYLSCPFFSRFQLYVLKKQKNHRIILETLNVKVPVWF